MTIQRPAGSTLLARCAATPGRALGAGVGAVSGATPDAGPTIEVGSGSMDGAGGSLGFGGRLVSAVGSGEGVAAGGIELAGSEAAAGPAIERRRAAATNVATWRRMGGTPGRRVDGGSEDCL
jgi:hypothetical protein